jgi:CubicO group peptidase (beta-lactamase class C family)
MSLGFSVLLLFATAQIFSVQTAYASTTADAIKAAYQARANASLIRGCAISISTLSDTQKMVFGDFKSENDLTEIGSISKSFTGIATATLIVEGKLDLELPISKYIPEFAGSYIGTVTVHQLATHAARLVDSYTDASGHVSESYSESQLISFLKAYVPDSRQFPAGGRSYSNVGFATVGLVLSRIEKMSLPEVVHQRVLRPLGLANTGFITSKVKPSGILTGYDVLLRPGNYTAESGLAAASGGIFSNLHDMTIYLNANLRPPKSSLGKAIQLSQKLGLGWDSNPGGLPIWKNGGMPAGYSSYLAFDSTPGKESGTLVLANVLNTSVTMGLGSIALTGKDSFLPETATNEIEGALIAKLIGTYINSDSTVKVQIQAMSNHFLAATLTAGTNAAYVRLYAFNPNLLLVDTGASVADGIKINFNQQGKLESLTYLSYQGTDMAGKPTYNPLQMSSK